MKENISAFNMKDGSNSIKEKRFKLKFRIKTSRRKEKVLFTISNRFLGWQRGNDYYLLI